MWSFVVRVFNVFISRTHTHDYKPMCVYALPTRLYCDDQRLPDGKTLELGSAQTRSWRTASSGFAELRKAFRNPVRQDRVWAEPNS